ncbi:DUF2742 domain-containing protein [Mycolicibacterium llatzerense]|uniref:DUF2742 domain-containing protein n=1 Tax=Mycolicibacterium llatzerense TaxID=280871 RepID=UPI0009F6702E|nr:DUF2742 domain-containing protein [Mycolicibacterium llatzerense]
MQPKDARPTTGAGIPESRQVAWWPVHEFIEAAVAQANCGPLPTPGTPAWCALADGDPRKLLALAAAGEHHVLRTETAQEIWAEAAKSIAESQDWDAVRRDSRRRAQATRSGAFIPRRSA